MTKRTLPKLAAVCSCIAVLAVACKKDDTTNNNNNNNNNSNDAKTMLLGTWNATHQATDSNKNSTIDATEKKPLTGMSLSITFKSDGSGSQHYVITGLVDTTESITWALINSDKDIVVTNGGEKDTSHIESLTSTDLTVKQSDDGSGMASWTILKKQ